MEENGGGGIGFLPFIIAIIVLIVLQIWFRRGGDARRRPELVQTLLTDVKINQAIIEAYHLRQKPRRFEVSGWMRYGKSISFLDESLRNTLTEVFSMAEDFNQRRRAILPVENHAASNQPSPQEQHRLRRWRRLAISK